MRTYDVPLTLSELDMINMVLALKPGDESRSGLHQRVMTAITVLDPNYGKGSDMSSDATVPFSMDGDEMSALCLMLDDMSVMVSALSARLRGTVGTRDLYTIATTLSRKLRRVLADPSPA